MRSALAFLTILPVGHAGPLRGRATLLGFPVAGLVVGLAWSGAAAVGVRWWTPAVAAALVLLVDLVITGALHQDAVGDVADAVGSRRPADTVREVLGDPRIGGIGAATLLVVGLLRFGALTAVTAELTVLVLVAVPVVGRAAMVVALATMPVGTRSLATDLVPAARGVTTGVNVAVAVGVAMLALAPVGGVVRGAVAAAVALVVAALAGTVWRRRYGFPSGDLAGACGVLAETVALLGISMA